MHRFSAGIATEQGLGFLGMIGIIFLLGGCGWSTLWYQSPQMGMVAESGSYFVSAGWGEYDDLTGKCSLKTEFQERGAPLDSLLILNILLITADTLQTPEYLQEHYDISHIWVTSDTSMTPIKLDVCKDSSAVSYSYVFQRRVAARNIWFGPLKVSWPFPKFFFVSCDLIYRNPETGVELSRERLQFEIRRIKQSALMELWRS